MSRINTNISSLQAIATLNKNQTDLSIRLSRLSSGLKINSGKDAPAGLIASESLRSEIAGINQAIDNSQRAGNVSNSAITIEVGGVAGSEQLSFAANTTTSAVAFAVNQLKPSTGVSAVVSGGSLRFTSTAYGSDQYVSVKTIAGTFLNNQDSGR